jgi:hypothetical protein
MGDACMEHIGLVGLTVGDCPKVHARAFVHLTSVQLKSVSQKNKALVVGSLALWMFWNPLLGESRALFPFDKWLYCLKI